MDIGNDIMTKLYRGGDVDLEYLTSALQLLKLHEVDPEDIATLTKVRTFIGQGVTGEFSSPRFNTIDDLFQQHGEPPQKYAITINCMRPFEYEQQVQAKLREYGLPTQLRKSKEGNAWDIPCGAICVHVFGLYKVEDAPQQPPEPLVSDDDVPF